MLALLAAIPSLLSGLFGTVNSITNAISNERIAGINAKTEEEKVASGERVKTLEARRDLMIAEAGTSRLNIYVRSCAAAGPVVFLLKVFIWDKVIGSFAGCSGRVDPGTCKSFVTDALDPNLWGVITAVLGFYFLYEGASAITRIIKR
jgi:hypothetical protein